MLKSLKTKKILSILNKIGFVPIRQKGDHLFLRHSDGRTTTIPLHKEIIIKLLTKIIKEDLMMEKEKFFELL